MKLTEEQKKANRLLVKAKKEREKILAKISEEKNQNHVKEMTLNIEWVKSRTWGSNPRLEAVISFHDGGFFRSRAFTCSGCGYDKESTVIADVFNEFLKYKLWGKTVEECKRNDYGWEKDGGAPYGISAGSYKLGLSDDRAEYRSYSGGIGVDCYRSIAKFIGGKFERIASGKTFDCYKYTDNEAN